MLHVVWNIFHDKQSGYRYVQRSMKPKQFDRWGVHCFPCIEIWMKYRIRINRALLFTCTQAQRYESNRFVTKSICKIYNAYENDILPLPYISLYSLIAAKILFEIQNKRTKWRKGSKVWKMQCLPVGNYSDACALS